ncbi:MAG: NADH dehydrogenase [Solobacterium sp.]|nr:NADH dehydrogenase [Solobacterium sp.]
MGNLILPILVFWPMIASIISYLIGRKDKKLRDYWADFVTIVEFVLALSMIPVVLSQGSVYFSLMPFGHDKLFFQMDGFRCIYGVITTFMWMCTTIFSREYFAHYRNRNRYYLFMLMTEGATVAVFLSGDVLTLFTFFEVMAFTSYVMVIHDEKPGAQRASETYTYLNVFGGLVTLMGIFLLYNTIGTLEIDKIKAACAAVTNRKMLYWAAGLMIVGFGGKSGMFPLHVWLPKAHPVAPAPASALLSGVLTKTGVYGIIIISCHMLFGDWTWGCVLLGIAVITMFGGAFLALFSVDLKRTLACSSMSQIGFILTAIAMQCILMSDPELTGQYHFYAVQGAILHMMNHSLIKLCLFMAAGVVYMNLHKLNLNDVRGFGYRKPLLKFIFGMGVLAIIGMPLWSGYISKTLIHESIVERIFMYHDREFAAQVFRVVESIFTLTGGLTTAYMTKIYIAVFWEKNPYYQEEMDASNGKYMNKASAFVLTLSSLVLPFFGMTFYKTMIPISEFGAGFMNLSGHPHVVPFLEWSCLRGAAASLAIGAIIYILIVRQILMRKDENGNKVYINAWPSFIDIEDYIYRPLMVKVLPFIGAFVTRTIGSIVEVIGSLGYKAFWAFANFYQPRKPNAHEFIESMKEFYPKHKLDARVAIEGMKEAYKNSNIETWDKQEEHRTIEPLERVPILDDFEDMKKAGYKVPILDRLFDRFANQYGDNEDGASSLNTMVRQTMSYGLIIFLIGLVIVAAYVVMAIGA